MGDTGVMGADLSGWKWLWQGSLCGVQMEPNRLDMGERLRVPEKYGCETEEEKVTVCGWNEKHRLKKIYNFYLALIKYLNQRF